MSTPDSALQQALQLHREPGLLFAMQGRVLPSDMARVLRIVSDESAAQAHARPLSLNPADLQQQCANYLRAVCLHAGSEPLRCLALNDAHDLRLAKEHHRLLMKWLHPDRNANQHVFAERVNQAWTQLKNGRLSQRLPVANAWAVTTPDAAPVSGSRFPLFLWLLLAAGLILLAIGLLWPEQEIYGNTDAAMDVAKKVQAESAATPEWAEPERLEMPNVDWQAATPAAAKPMPAPEIKMPAVIASPPAPVKKMLADAGPPPAPKASKNPMSILSEKQAVKRQTKVAGVAVPVLSSANPVPLAVNTSVQMASILEVQSNQGEALQMLQAFARHYQAGQIDPFMALFSADARNDRGGRGAIAEDYGRLFRSSHRRSLDLSRLQWQPQDSGWRLNARYVAKVQRNSDLLPVKNKGTIELDFADEGGRLRIRRIALK
jgi:hypothetical protein